MAALIGAARRSACRRRDLGILVARLDRLGAVLPAPTFQKLRYPDGLEISQTQSTLNHIIADMHFQRGEAACL